MAYQVSQGVFVDGTVIDADDFLNEFGLIAGALGTLTTDYTQKITQLDQTLRAHIQNLVDTLPVDGGTF